MLNYKYKLIDICINRYKFQVVDNYNKGTKVEKNKLFRLSIETVRFVFLYKKLKESKLSLRFD